MLAAAQRLRRSGEFAATVRGGRRASRGALVVHLKVPDRSEYGAARAGFVVPKTVGVAVVRNRVKRRLRHLLRDRLAQL
ncbi:MAG TPA: ribonuclease P protein component, partial [Rugosimonospora sp.]|nr:ribonuclease P protein component [Rugosimonospora sp.]